MYEIILSKSAKKYLDKLEFKDRNRILNALERLRIRPEAHLTRLVGAQVYKFKVGNFRLIIDLDKKTISVIVIKIDHRRNIYK